MRENDLLAFGRVDPQSWHPGKLPRLEATGQIRTSGRNAPTGHARVEARSHAVELRTVKAPNIAR